MTRSTRARIDLNALRHNLAVSRQFAPHSRVMAVIKANGYGHGMTQVARALDTADAFAVATVDEAVILRQAGIEHPVLVLEGCFSNDDLDTVTKLNLQTVVHHFHQIELLENRACAEPCVVWLKVDTGMHRLGISPSQLQVATERLESCPGVAKPIRLMTHFANSRARAGAILKPWPLPPLKSQ